MQIESHESAWEKQSIEIIPTITSTLDLLLSLAILNMDEMEYYIVLF